MEKEYELVDNNRAWNPRRARVLMVLVVIVTAIAIWLVPGGEEQTPTSLPTLPPEPESSEELALPPPSGGIATVTSGGNGARAFLYEGRAGGAQPEATWGGAEADERERLALCSINLSGQSLGDEKFLPFVVDQFQRSGSEATKSGVEITETAASAS